MFGIRSWGKWLKRASLCQQPKRALRRATTAETLENRVLLFTTSGSAWPTKDLITISFMPDGTDLGGGKVSNMVATLNAKFGTAAKWQNQILKGAQFWAEQTDINFAVKSDNG